MKFKVINVYKKSIKSFFLTAALLSTSAYASSISMPGGEIDADIKSPGQVFSESFRNALQSGDTQDVVIKNNIPPAEYFIRVAIEMILESLRLQEMAKNQKEGDDPIDASRAINVGQNMFSELISISSNPEVCKKNTDKLKNNRQYKEYLGQSFFEVPVKSSGSCMFHAFRESLKLEEFDEKETRDWLKETLLNGLNSDDNNTSEKVKIFLKAEYYKNFFSAEATANVELMRMFVSDVIGNNDLMNELNNNELNLILELNTLYVEFFTNQENNTFMQISEDGAKEHNDRILKNLEEKLQKKFMINAISFQEQDLNINLLKAFTQQVICSTVSEDMRYFGNNNLLEALAFAIGTNVCLFLSKDTFDSEKGLVNREWMKKETIVNEESSNYIYLRLMSLHYDALHLIK